MVDHSEAALIREYLGKECHGFGPKGATPYEILGVRHEATEAELRQAFNQLSSKMHADKLENFKDFGYSLWRQEIYKSHDDPNASCARHSPECVACGQSLCILPG